MSELPYRRLEVWQKAMALAMEVLDLAETEGLARRFYFRDQMCAAAMSVPANIAEGNGRSTPLDYAAFLDRARGSLFELDTWLLAAGQRSYVTADAAAAFSPRIEELSAMLRSLAIQLRRKPSLDSRSPR
ncbi:MAG: four helix bundle protein [Dehalococcoidia bacterium]|nr:four helix bundle protein [Dehalococcoidia bacterium]